MTGFMKIETRNYSLEGLKFPKDYERSNSIRRFFTDTAIFFSKKFYGSKEYCVVRDDFYTSQFYVEIEKDWLASYSEAGQKQYLSEIDKHVMLRGEHWECNEFVLLNAVWMPDRC